MSRLRLAPLVLAALAAAPLLGGCTLTFGLTGATIDNVSARRPSVVYTLDEPPPRDTPVEVVTRDGQSETGRWSYGSESAGADSVGSVVVLQSRRSGRVDVPEDLVAKTRSRPPPTRITGPVIVAAVVIGTAIAIYYINRSCFYDACGVDSQ